MNKVTLVAIGYESSISIHDEMLEQLKDHILEGIPKQPGYVQIQCESVEDDYSLTICFENHKTMFDFGIQLLNLCRPFIN